MTDVSDATPDAPPADADPGAVEVPEATPVEQAVADDLPEGQNLFERSYVEGLRGEAAKHRTRAKEAEAIWEGYDDESLEKMQGIVRGVAENPAQAIEDVEWLLGRLQAVSGLEPAEQAEAVEEIAEELGEPEVDLNDPEQLQALIDQRIADAELEQATERAADQILEQVAEWGYSMDEDPASMRLLFDIAQNDPAAEESIEKAHEILTEWRSGIEQSAVKAYIESVGGSVEDYPPQVTAGGAPAVAKVDAPKTMADAKKAADARLKAFFEQNPRGGRD